MEQVQAGIENFRFMLHFHPVIDLTDEGFFHFCRINRELQLEKTSEGSVLIMTPAGGMTSWRNSELITALNIWAKQNGEGVVFDSSCGFILSNGAIRSPDAAWIKRCRLAGLTENQKSKFIPLCPDFVVELCSPSDVITVLKDKMTEYIANGALLGWLIDPDRKNIYIYQPAKDTVCLNNLNTISGDPVLSGFMLDLTVIWNPGF